MRGRQQAEIDSSSLFRPTLTLSSRFPSPSHPHATRSEALRGLHLSPIPSVAHHPVSEAVFNFVVAWATMFAPVILSDAAAAAKVKGRPGWATAIAFTTNIAFFPFLALRAAPLPPAADAAPAPRRARPARGGTQRVGAFARATGAATLALCALSIAFAFVGRPEYGGLAERAAYLQSEIASNRVFWAFFLDCGLFAAWQALLLEGAAPAYRFVPVEGLAAWLI